MASIEELLRQLLQGQGNTAGVALEDPEYQLDVTNLQGQQGEAEADYLSQQTETQARYERMRRAAERQLPENITNVKESAASRGMFHAGGRVEAEGRLNQDHANTVASLAEQQTGDLNNLLRGITTRRNETQRGVSLAQQNAAQRALERAKAQAAATPVPTPVAAPVAQPAQTPIARAVANNPAVRPPAAAKTPAQLEQERRWLEYVRYNPENARRVVLAARAKAAGR